MGFKIHKKSNVLGVFNMFLWTFSDDECIKNIKLKLYFWAFLYPNPGDLGAVELFF